MRASERVFRFAAARDMRSLTYAAVAAGGGLLTTLLYWLPGAAVAAAVAAGPAAAFDAAFAFRAVGVELSVGLLFTADTTTGATALASLLSRRCCVPDAAVPVTCKSPFWCINAFIFSLWALSIAA
jgi:hypothetical protein